HDVAFERIPAYESQPPGDDVVEVHGSAHFLAVAHHAANAPTDFTRPVPVRDDGFEQAIQFQQVRTPFGDETPASAGAAHDTGERLVQLVRERPSHFSHDRDAAEVREFFAVLPCFRFGLLAGGDVHDDTQNQR